MSKFCRKRINLKSEGIEFTVDSLGNLETLIGPTYAFLKSKNVSAVELLMEHVETGELFSLTAQTIDGETISEELKRLRAENAMLWEKVARMEGKDERGQIHRPGLPGPGRERIPLHRLEKSGRGRPETAS